jgi:hypothetical protein
VWLCALLSFVRTMCLFCSLYVLCILMCIVLTADFVCLCLCVYVCVCLTLYLCVCLCVCSHLSLSVRVCVCLSLLAFFIFFWASQLCVSVAVCFAFFCKNYVFVLFFVRPLHLNTSNRLDKKIQYPPQALLIFVCCNFCYY